MTPIVRRPSCRPALGSVVDEDRGSLPFALIHGEALVACAVVGAGRGRRDAGRPRHVRGPASPRPGEPFVLHDPLCPMTPPAFIAACVARAVERDRVVVGVRPVTDTVKRVADGVVGETVDRAGLVVGGLAGRAAPRGGRRARPACRPTTSSSWSPLRAAYPVELVEAPPRRPPGRLGRGRPACSRRSTARP